MFSFSQGSYRLFEETNLHKWSKTGMQFIVFFFNFLRGRWGGRGVGERLVVPLICAFTDWFLGVVGRCSDQLRWPGLDLTFLFSVLPACYQGHHVITDSKTQVWDTWVSCWVLVWFPERMELLQCIFSFVWMPLSGWFRLIEAFPTYGGPWLAFATEGC